MPLVPAAMAASMAVTMSVASEFAEPVHAGAGYAEDRGRVLEPVDRGRKERVGRHVVDERELVSRVAGEHRVVAVPEGLSGGAALGEDVDKTTEERHRGRSDARIAQEPPPGYVIFLWIHFIGFCAIYLPFPTSCPLSWGQGHLGPLRSPLWSTVPDEGTSSGMLALTEGCCKEPPGNLGRRS